jgi:aspartyl-tRNA(Asn)/glutamyl-tRNA(Gln) amidotransferase subunit B
MSIEYRPTIGLEIHAELKTATKMFCASANSAAETSPNVNVCPVCLAHPGTLPVINKQAIRHVLRVGLALGSDLADYTEFDRKNYFYPDLPKGYQLSQFEYPLVKGGALNGIAITRVHLEEDTASSIHDEKSGETLVDYNRAGVPLMELVTEPVIHSGEEAAKFGRELQLLLRYLDASDADMEKGQMRLEANVSVSSTEILGTKVEIKNINSFRAVERAVSYEIDRQKRLLESGGRVIQETRGWDEGRQITFSQRVKEGSADYRYFPDPDLPSLNLSEVEELKLKNLQSSLPILPWQKRAEYSSVGLRSEDIEMYVRSPKLGAFFDAVSTRLGGDAEKIRLASNYITNDLVNLLKDSEAKEQAFSTPIPISPTNFAKLIDLAFGKKISSRSAKDILIICAKEDIDPQKIAEEKKLFQTTASLDGVVTEVIANNQAVVADYKNGKQAALEFLVGQAMKQLRGAADAGALREILRKQLGVS